jgi:hypothetical protein
VVVAAVAGEVDALGARAASSTSAGEASGAGDSTSPAKRAATAAVSTGAQARSPVGSASVSIRRSGLGALFRSRIGLSVSIDGANVTTTSSSRQRVPS